MPDYIKDFDRWNEVKKTLNKRSLGVDFLFLEREIWWASIGINVGEEIDGKNNNFERPILVIVKINENNLLALPITTSVKEGDFFFKIRSGKEDATIYLSQVRHISANRLLRLHSRLNEQDFEEIRSKISGIFGTGQRNSPSAGGVSVP